MPGTGPGLRPNRGARKEHSTMAAIPDKYLDLLQQKKAFANLATVMPDGSPQVTPVWFDYTNGVIRVKTARGLRLPSWILITPTATSRFAAGSSGRPKRARARISTSWRRNIWGKTS